MADDFTTPVPGGKTFAADEVGGKLHQRVKVTHGADGTANDTSPANPLPVELHGDGVAAAGDPADSSTQILYVQPLDADGNVIVSGGGGGDTAVVVGASAPQANDGPSDTDPVLYVQPVDRDGNVMGSAGGASSGPGPSTRVLYVQPVDESGDVITGGGGSSETLVTKRFNLAGVISDGGSATLLADPGDGFRIIVVGYAMGIYVTNAASPNEQWRVSLISGPETLAELHFVNNGGTITYAGTIEAPALVGLESWSFSIRADRYQGSDGDINVIGHYTYYIGAV